MNNNGVPFKIESLRHKEACHLIIVGQDDSRELFCFEHRFDIEQLADQTLKVRFPLKGVNPLERLESAAFVEMSIRDRGTPYSAIVKISRHDYVDHRCTLWLTLPDRIYTNENRQYVRVHFPSGVPMTCEVVGVRGQTVSDGIPFPCKMIDVSAGGLSFVTSAKLFQPLCLSAKFSLPGGEQHFEVFGEIARCTPFQQGLNRVAMSFLDVPNDVLRKIDEYCIANQA